MAQYTIVSPILINFVSIFFIFNLFQRICRGSTHFKRVSSSKKSQSVKSRLKMKGSQQQISPYPSQWVIGSIIKNNYGHLSKKMCIKLHFSLMKHILAYPICVKYKPIILGNTQTDITLGSNEPSNQLNPQTNWTLKPIEPSNQLNPQTNWTIGAIVHLNHYYNCTFEMIEPLKQLNQWTNWTLNQLNPWTSLTLELI